MNSNTVRSLAIAAVAVVLAAAAWLLVLPLFGGAPSGIMVAVSDLPDSLNPVLAQNLMGMNANELIFDGLTNQEVDEKGVLNTVLALASEIVQDPNTKKTYTVKLKEAKFHDGKVLTADDVQFSFQCYVEPANKSPQREYLDSFIQEVKVVDEKTVTFEFRDPIPTFRVYPVLSFKIIPSAYQSKKLGTNLLAGENERKFSTAPVGTGPYAFKSWEVGKWISFQANADYFRKRPGAESLTMRKIIDPVVRLNEFQQGRVNLVLESTPLDRAVYEKIPGAEVSPYFPYAFTLVAINTTVERLARTDARRALVLALDRKNLLAGVTDRPDAVLNTGPLPSNLFKRNLPEYKLQEYADPYPFDLPQARDKAAATGLASQPLSLLFPDSLGAQWSAAGIKVEAKRTGDQVFKRLVFAEKKYDLALLTADGFDNYYSGLVQWYSSTGTRNIFGLADKVLDDDLAAWTAAVDVSGWLKVAQRIHQRLSDLVPAAYLFTLEKDAFSKGVDKVSILSDNPFLSAEDWSLK